MNSWFSSRLSLTLKFRNSLHEDRCTKTTFVTTRTVSCRMPFAARPECFHDLSCAPVDGSSTMMRCRRRSVMRIRRANPTIRRPVVTTSGMANSSGGGQRDVPISQSSSCIWLQRRVVPGLTAEFSISSSYESDTSRTFTEPPVS